jgi:hypothetical protein
VKSKSGGVILKRKILSLLLSLSLIISLGFNTQAALGKSTKEDNHQKKAAIVERLLKLSGES